MISAEAVVTTTLPQILRHFLQNSPLAFSLIKTTILKFIWFSYPYENLMLLVIHGYLKALGHDIDISKWFVTKFKRIVRGPSFR